MGMSKPQPNPTWLGMPVIHLGAVARVWPSGNGVRHIFTRVGDFAPDEHAALRGGYMTALWNHKTADIQTMRAQPDYFIAPKNGKANAARKLWRGAGTLLLPARLCFNTAKVVCVRLPDDMPSLGSAWAPCKRYSGFELTMRGHGMELNNDGFEKALCAYLNSTMGVFAMLGERSATTLQYGRFSLANINLLKIPDFSKVDFNDACELADAYGRLCEEP